MEEKIKVEGIPCPVARCGGCVIARKDGTYRCDWGHLLHVEEVEDAGDE